MKVITGVDDNRLSYEQNAEGKYDIKITSYDRKNHYRTGFIFDSIELMNPYLLRVSQTDSEGKKKFGLIAVHGWTQIFHPCNFSSINPNSNSTVSAWLEWKQFIIDSYGRIYNENFWRVKTEKEVGFDSDGRAHWKKEYWR